MKETCTLKKLVQIKVIASPLRMKLLEAFSHEPITTKQVAQSLGIPPTKLYHHVDALEHAGLVKLVKTQKKRGTTEKYYQTVAHHFSVDRKIFELRPKTKKTLDELQTMVTSMFDDTLSEINQSIAEKLIKPKNKHIPTILTHSYISTTPEQIEKMYKKIDKLIKGCETMKYKRGAMKYGLTMALYPVKKKKNLSTNYKDRRKK
jgi:predicted ArsR family transcriptional regulator